MAKKAKKAKGTGLWAEFKAFINKGNAFMLAVGVVIGGAFSAIVNAFVNILMSVATWAVPGGLAGLVTVLPAVSVGQKGLEDIGQSFAAGEFDNMAELISTKAGEASKVYGANILTSNYTKYGARWYFNGSAIINWGALINAVISFLIVAVVLFIIVKVINTIAKKKAELEAKALEEYYKKHPAERPVPPEPGEPVPTELDYLKEIRDALVKKEAK